MTPLVSAVLAATWLAFVSAYFWWRRMVQVAFAHTPKGGPTARTRRT